MTASPGFRLSVVIPAYNEAERLPSTLGKVIAYLGGQPFAAEILVVDDGSSDGTAEVAERAGSVSVPVRLLRQPDRRNHGKGAAVRRGMLAASGAYRLFMDSDNSTTIDQIERFWPLFGRGHDLVVGSRAVAGARIDDRQPWYKETAGKAGNLLIRALLVPGVRDTQAGFKMLTGAAAEDLFPRLTIDRWGFDVELLAVARKRGYRIAEAPIVWRNSPESKVRAADYLRVLSDVWTVRRRLRSGLYD